MAVLVAIVFVLQYMGVSIMISQAFGIGIALTLVPIVMGAVLYGPAFGAVLGTVFGLVVAYSVTQGMAGAVSAVMYAESPILTLFLCVFKGLAAGFAAGIAGKLLMKKNQYLGALCAAIACPVVNTGIFLGGLLLYPDFAGATSLFFVIVLCNFALELVFNVICAPVIVRVIQALKKSGILKINTGNV